MSRTIALTREKSVPDDARQYTINKMVHVGPVSLRVLTIASLASLLLFYLAETTQSATRSYEVQSLTEEKQELVEDVERLELEAQRLQTLGSIQEGLGEKATTEFEPAKELKTVQE